MWNDLLLTSQTTAALNAGEAVGGSSVGWNEGGLFSKGFLTERNRNVLREAADCSKWFEAARVCLNVSELKPELI